MRRLRSGPVILCADDYGMAAGVSRGILELATASRICALSAMVTFERWPQDAGKLAEVRDRVAIGLHLNLTVGRPLGPMPRLAPHGTLPPIGALTRLSLQRQIDPGEIRAEVGRQIARFEREAGFPPDHVDGHQHVHVLPGVRRGVLDALTERFTASKPLLRDPSDRGFSISARGGEMAKAFGLVVLAAGFGFQARRRGFPVNRGFSGFSAFDKTRNYDIEIASAFRMTGPRHIVMCHPGYPDAELAALDPVVERRGQELQSIRENPELPRRLWQPDRSADGPPIDWVRALPDG